LPNGAAVPVASLESPPQIPHIQPILSTLKHFAHKMRVSFVHRPFWIWYIFTKRNETLLPVFVW